MFQVNRTNNLKIPKTIEKVSKELNSVNDKIAILEAQATANNEKFDKDKIIDLIEKDKELEQVNKIPSNANDLIVITASKKLGAYVIAVTEKSPAKYRGVFVNRMQNMSLEIIELLLQANFIRLDKKENKQKREEFQKNAIIKLKMLGYISMLASNSGCILSRQFKQISIQIGETINLVSAWKKSDDRRWGKN